MDDGMLGEIVIVGGRVALVVGDHGDRVTMVVWDAHGRQSTAAASKSLFAPGEDAAAEPVPGELAGDETPGPIPEVPA